MRGCCSGGSILSVPLRKLRLCCQTWNRAAHSSFKKSEDNGVFLIFFNFLPVPDGGNINGRLNWSAPVQTCCRWGIWFFECASWTVPPLLSEVTDGVRGRFWSALSQKEKHLANERIMQQALLFCRTQRHISGVKRKVERLSHISSFEAKLKNFKVIPVYWQQKRPSPWYSHHHARKSDSNPRIDPMATNLSQSERLYCWIWGFSPTLSAMSQSLMFDAFLPGQGTLLLLNLPVSDGCGLWWFLDCSCESITFYFTYCDQKQLSWQEANTFRLNSAISDMKSCQTSGGTKGVSLPCK